MSVTFDIKGVSDVVDMLEKVGPRHSRNLMRATIHGVASEIAKEAKKNAPKDRGTLRKAIKAKRKRSKPERPVSEVRVEHGSNAKNDAFYWRFVEYGTRGKTGHPEHPFIRPAADNARQNFKEILSQQFGKKLEAALKREARRWNK